MLQYIFAILILNVAVLSAELPDYFQKCSKSDMQLDKCLTKSAIAAWPRIVQGDESIDIPILNPLNVPVMNFPIHKYLSGNMTDVKVTGLANMKINEIQMNFCENVLDIKFKVPRFILLGAYDVAGIYLGIVPIKGEGDANITFSNMENHLQMKYELIKKDNKHYVTITKNALVYKITNLHFNMTNLFGGNKILGYLTHKILNENWASVNKEVRSTLSRVFGNTFTDVLKGFFKNVPFEELFLD